MLNDKIMDLFQNLFGWVWKWLFGPFKELRGFKDLIFGKDGDVDLPYISQSIDSGKSEQEAQPHLAQTVTGPNGESMIASSAVRMVTTSDKTIIQVLDKTGQVQTFFRIASGDSSFQKGQTIYQDLTINDDQLTPSTNVYSEDSGGGRITLNREYYNTTQPSDLVPKFPPNKRTTMKKQNEKYRNKSFTESLG